MTDFDSGGSGCGCLFGVAVPIIGLIIAWNTITGWIEWFVEGLEGGTSESYSGFDADDVRELFEPDPWTDGPELIVDGEVAVEIMQDRTTCVDLAELDYELASTGESCENESASLHLIGRSTEFGMVEVHSRGWHSFSFGRLDDQPSEAIDCIDPIDNHSRLGFSLYYEWMDDPDQSAGFCRFLPTAKMTWFEISEFQSDGDSWEATPSGTVTFRVLIWRGS